MCPQDKCFGEVGGEGDETQQSRLWPRNIEGMNLCSREGTCHKHRPSHVRAGWPLSCMGHETKYEVQNPWKGKSRCCAVFKCWGERAHFHPVGLNQSTECPQVKNRDKPQGHWKLEAPNRRKWLSTNPMKPSGPLCSFIHHVMHTPTELPEMQMGRKVQPIIQKKITKDFGVSMSTSLRQIDKKRDKSGCNKWRTVREN